MGASAQTLAEQGYVRRVKNVCDIKWEPARRLSARGIDLEFRLGDPDDLDDIHVANRLRKTEVVTRTGLTVGAKLQDLRRTYGTQLRRASFEREGGKYTSYILFGDDGALMFNFTEYDQQTVNDISAVRGTSVKNIQPTPGGC